MFLKFKNLGLTILMVTVLSVFSVNAQNAHPKVIALLTKASWCPVCKANGPRFKKDIMPMVMKNKAIKMIALDMSDKNTIASSKKMLKSAGIPLSFMQTHKATGLVYFFNAKTKKLINEVSIANPNMQIEMTLKAAMKAAN